ncbi:MAG: S1C family serine protease, partial [Oscillospiraceae bacterium]|nr:S1C family serine protease [Oscillospiraceae bacterium]
YWADLYLSDMINQNNSKFVCSGKIGYKEYLFCYFAMQLNIQVMLLLPEGDLKIASEYLEKSQVIQLGTASIANIPEFKKKVNKINTVRPASWKQQRQQPNASSKPMRKPEININRMMQKPKRRELHYEELAKFAESVVIIGVYDRNGNFKGSGSGIAISRQGYILTNCHVIHDGRIYSVRLENDEEIYTSCQVIKYHTQFDLAVIKINKELKPLKIYDGKKELLRGQKVIAIGSPMGLFNSVSDGIISGFRKIDNLDMIQFTAPVADGSCGGALLNTYGEVIGITTAHVRRSENMNLAVSYQQVLPFILGFLGG